MEKITFLFPLQTESLEDFFNAKKDRELRSFLYRLDLTEFDLSSVKNFKNAFSYITSLEEIIFPTDKKVYPTDVTEMHKGCEFLKSIDLSMFDLSECEKFNQMIDGTTYLRNLFLREFNFKNEDVVKNIFFNGINLDYLDIYDAKGATETIKNRIKITESLQVCQSKFIIPEKLQICCNGTCNDNFIEVYYKESCDYSYRFNNDNRQIGIDYLLKLNNNIFVGAAAFSVSKGDKLEIHFAQNLTRLASFFHYEDGNMQYVYSIDLSHLVTTSLTSIQGLFYHGGNIESITFNCDLSNVRSLVYSFYGCNSLKALNLRNFTTSENVKTQYMFDGVKGLHYLDIYGLDDGRKNIFNHMKNLKNLIVCKDENLNFTSSYWKYICCDHNATTDRCESSNYISIQYESQIEITGFGNNNRSELLFLMKKIKHMI